MNQIPSENTQVQFSSGEWNGFYVERFNSKRGWMHLYLEFAEGKVTGEGTDYVGPWVLSGSYDENTGKCSWTKKYMGKHIVKYAGTLGPNGISGSWTIAGMLRGPFHIWPRQMIHLNEMYLKDDLERDQARMSGSPSVMMDDRDTSRDLPI